MPFYSSKWPRLSKLVVSPIMNVMTAKTGCTIAFALSVTCRSMHPMPELRVNFLECWETLDGKVQHFSWVTDLRVNKGTVYRLMQGARARWRIENETFNTLKNQGYHFEHNFGHGYQHLSVVFAMLMMLAFLVDQVQQLCCPLFQAAWAKWGSKRLLWEKMRALFYDYALESMRQLFEALLYGLKKSAPTLAPIPLNLPLDSEPVRPLGAMEPAHVSWSWRSYVSTGARSYFVPRMASIPLRVGCVTSDNGSSNGSERGIRHRSYRNF